MLKNYFLRDLQIQVGMHYAPLQYCPNCKWTTCVKTHRFCAYGCGPLALWVDRWLYDEIDFSLIEDDWL